MSRVHDMGGRFGDGAVVPEPEGNPFQEDWHARALALTLAMGAHGKWNIDVSRHARERLPAADYARYSYYEKWLGGMTNLLVETGLVTKEELAGATPQPSEAAAGKLLAPDVAAAMAKGGPADRNSKVAAVFGPGDAVRTLPRPGNREVPGGHTRLPGYAAGAKGTVVMLHGTHVLPDKSAHRLGDGAEPLYAVAFPASELWVHPEHPGDEVVLDLWQSYLVPA